MTRFPIAELVAESPALVRDKAKGHVELEVALPGDITVDCRSPLPQTIPDNLLSKPSNLPRRAAAS